MAASSAFAQPAAVEWTATAKIVNGTCGDKAMAHVSEKPGSMHLRLVYANGQQYAEFDVPLAADGSGKAVFPGSVGPTTFEAPSGAGKRLLKTTQVQGICQWAWTPM